MDKTELDEALKADAELGEIIRTLLHDIKLLTKFASILQDARYEHLLHLSGCNKLSDIMDGYSKQLDDIEDKLKLVTIKGE